MKNFKLLALVALFSTVLVFSSCGYHPIEAGYVGVKVDKLGSDKGVQKEVLPVGRYFPTFNEEIYDFPTFQVNYVFTAASDEGSKNNEQFTFQTAEGMECSCDLGVAMHFDVVKIPEMFQTYRKGVDEIREIVIRREIRDAINRVGGGMPVESVYGAGKGKLIDSVKSIVRGKLNPHGIIVDDISLIGSIRIPEGILKALNAKVEMNQDAEKARNEVAKAEAKAKTLLVQAQAEAEANRLRQQTLTPMLLQQQFIQKWDGKLPVYGTVPTMFKSVQ